MKTKYLLSDMNIDPIYSTQATMPSWFRPFASIEFPKVIDYEKTIEFIEHAYKEGYDVAWKQAYYKLVEHMKQRGDYAKVYSIIERRGVYNATCYKFTKLMTKVERKCMLKEQYSRSFCGEYAHYLDNVVKEHLNGIHKDYSSQIVFNVNNVNALIKNISDVSLIDDMITTWGIDFDIGYAIDTEKFPAFFAIRYGIVETLKNIMKQYVEGWYNGLCNDPHDVIKTHVMYEEKVIQDMENDNDTDKRFEEALKARDMLIEPPTNIISGSGPIFTLEDDLIGRSNMMHPSVGSLEGDKKVNETFTRHVQEALDTKQFEVEFKVYINQSFGVDIVACTYSDLSREVEMEVLMNNKKTHWKAINAWIVRRSKNAAFVAYAQEKHQEAQQKKIVKEITDATEDKDKGVPHHCVSLLFGSTNAV
jgi:hypothetical protein